MLEYSNSRKHFLGNYQELFKYNELFYAKKLVDVYYNLCFRKQLKLHARKGHSTPV